MAKKTRGVFQVIFKSIVEGARPKLPSKLMGEDFHGTKYFEEPPATSGRKSRGRYFVPVNEDNFEQEVPAEWEAWLRYRRAIPPTEEEVQANYQMILTKRDNAARLDVEYGKNKDRSSEKEQQHAMMNFPVYEEYKNFGINDDVDNTKKK